MSKSDSAFDFNVDLVLSINFICCSGDTVVCVEIKSFYRPVLALSNTKAFATAEILSKLQKHLLSVA